ncbi:MAG: lipocalin family protein [Cyclobacteriaceae bacterium]
MKNLFKNRSWIFIVVIFIAIGCSKSSSSSSVNLSGTWKLTAEKATGCTDSNNNYNESCTSSCPVLVLTSTAYTFKDGSGNVIDTGTYTVGGGKITIKPATGGSAQENITISGNTFMISETDGSDGCTYTDTYTKQ